LAAMTQRSSATMTSSSSQVHGSVHKFRTWWIWSKYADNAPEVV
jgi:hypothetical protein